MRSFGRGLGVRLFHWSCDGGLGDGVCGIGVDVCVRSGIRVEPANLFSFDQANFLFELHKRPDIAGHKHHQDRHQDQHHDYCHAALLGARPSRALQRPKCRGVGILQRARIWAASCGRGRPRSSRWQCRGRVAQIEKGRKGPKRRKDRVREFEQSCKSGHCCGRGWPRSSR
jgi:hypothetical protein